MWQPRHDRVDLDYLVYFICTPAGLGIASQASPGGAGRNRTLNQSTFLVSRIPLPPLPEQKKIAAILSSVDEAIQATQAVIEQTRRVKEGLLQELLTRGIGHTRFKQTPIGEIPEVWDVLRVGDLMEVQLGKMLSPKAKRGNNPRPYLRNVNVQWGRFLLDDLFEMDFEEREMKKFRLSVGDILMCEGGEIGRCAIWREEIEECYYQKALHRLRPFDKAVLMPEFAFAFFERHFRFGVSSFVESGATTFSHLTLEKLKRMPFCIPSMAEQRRIIGVLTSFEETEQGSGLEERCLYAAKAGLLQDLLTGKVRVSV
jgi:type I restriction enzyme S subunit